MSWLSNIFGGTKDSTSTSSSGLSDNWNWLDTGLSGAAQTGTSNYFSDPSYNVAGFTPDQLTAFQGIRDTTQYGNDNRYSPYMDAYIGDNNNFASNFANMQGRANAAIPMAAQYATTNMDDIAALANPFYQGMTDVAVGRINDSRDTALNQNAATAAQRSAFGGSGEALARANIDKDTAQQIADTSKGIAYDSFGQGMGLAMQNTANKNAAIANTVNAIQNSANYDLNALGQADNSYSNYINRGINSIGAGADILGNEQQQILQANGLLSDAGDKQQALNQAIADQDWTTASRLLGLTGLADTTTTTTQPVNNSGSLGTALTLGSLFF